MNPRTPWRREELALLESWSDTDAVLAQQLGRSAQAIRNQRWRRTNPDALVKQRAYAQGRGARLAYIRGRIQREQLNAYARARTAAARAAATNSGPYGPEEDAVVLRVDLSIGTVATKLGRTPDSVRKRRRLLLGRLDPIGERT